MAVETTAEIYKQLVKNAVSRDTTLDSTLKAALTLRTDAMPVQNWLKLAQAGVESVTGNAVEVPANGVVKVVLGVPPTPTRVVFDAMTFLTPLRVSGADGASGFLEGHIGSSALPRVATADISVEYRLTSSDAWAVFNRNTVIPSTKTIQFAVNVASQLADSALPVLWIPAEQV